MAKVKINLNYLSENRTAICLTKRQHLVVRIYEWEQCSRFSKFIILRNSKAQSNDTTALDGNTYPRQNMSQFV